MKTKRPESKVVPMIRSFLEEVLLKNTKKELQEMADERKLIYTKRNTKIELVHILFLPRGNTREEYEKRKSLQKTDEG